MGKTKKIKTEEELKQIQIRSEYYELMHYVDKLIKEVIIETRDGDIDGTEMNITCEGKDIYYDSYYSRLDYGIEDDMEEMLDFRHIDKIKEVITLLERKRDKFRSECTDVKQLRYEVNQLWDRVNYLMEEKDDTEQE